MAKREAALMPDRRTHAAPAPPSTAPAPLPRGLLDSLQLLSSVLFRALVYIFLQWIPTSAAWPAVPLLFGVYAFTWSVHAWRLSRRNAAARALREMASSIPVGQLRLAAGAGRQAVGHAAGAEEPGEGSALLPAPTTDEHAAPVPHVEAPGKAPRPGFFARIAPSIFGLSSSSPGGNALALAQHVLLLLFFLDAFSSPYLFPSHHEHTLHFARVGHLSPNSAVLHVRYPFPLGQETADWAALLEEESGLRSTLRAGSEIYQNPAPLRVVYREALAPRAERDIDGRARSQPKRWERGPAVTLTAATDWTGAATLEGLWPGTAYEWRLAFVHNSTFAPHPHRPRSFVTWPDPKLARKRLAGVPQSQEGQGTPLDDPNHFTFATSSCVKPDFPWQPTQFWAWSWILRALGHGEHGGYATRNRIPGFDQFADALIDGRERPAVRFFLQLGDLIYADVPRWGGAVTNAYRLLFRNLYASESFRRVYERLPVIGIYDDHEVKNNWSGYELQRSDDAAPDVGRNKAFEPANQAWQEYVGSANPPAVEQGRNYYSFRYGDSAFFVLDTRAHRSPPELPDDEHKSMLGQEQREIFLRWLGAVNSTATFKFVVSSVPFNTLWGGPLDFDGQVDSWSAYRTEREGLLEVMQYVPNIIVLSGDRHEHAAVGLRAQSYERPDVHPVTEFSTSPMSMFYLPVRTFSEEHGLGPTGAERVYKYTPDGNVKWSTFEVDTRDSQAPVVTSRLYVDGEVVWTLKVHGKGVQPPALQVGGLARSFLELLGLQRRRWF